MSERECGAYNSDGTPFIPTPSLALTDDERASIDEAIKSVPVRMRRMAIIFERPRFMDKEPEPLRKLDGLIVEVLTELKRSIPADVAEKLFDRMMMSSVTDQYEDEQGSIGIMCFRLFDSMQCMVAIKERYRGQKRSSMYDKQYATEQLRLRGLLK
jgi:hypothetical protein